MLLKQNLQPSGKKLVLFFFFFEKKSGKRIKRSLILEPSELEIEEETPLKRKKMENLLLNYCLWKLSLELQRYHFLLTFPLMKLNLRKVKLLCSRKKV